QECKVRLVAGESEDEVIFQGDRPLRGEYIHFSRPYFCEPALEKGLYLTMRDAVLDVRTYPVFYPLSDAFAPYDERHIGSFPERLQRCVDRRIAGAYDNHFLTGIVMWVVIVMAHLGQVFTRDAHPAGNVVKSGGNDHMAGTIGRFSTGYFEPRAKVMYHRDFFKQPDIEPEFLLDPAVVFQRFCPFWLGVR